MKTVTIREAKAELSRIVKEAQSEPVCLTRHGRPVAIVSGVEGQELEEVVIQNSPTFWAAVEKARKGKRLSLGEVKKKYGAR